MKLLCFQLILVALLVSTATALVDMKTKVSMYENVHELLTKTVEKRFQTVEKTNDFTIKDEPTKFSFKPHDGKAQVHDEAEGSTDVNIKELDDTKHKIAQITHRYLMQVPGKEETQRVVFTVTYILDQDESLYVHYTSGIVDGRQQISYNSPIKLNEIEAKNDALKSISSFIIKGIKREVMQFVDKIIQTIASPEKLKKELQDLGQQMKSIDSTLQFGEILHSTSSKVDPETISSSQFDLAKELDNLYKRDQYYGMLFRDNGGKEQMFVDLFKELTGGPKDDPWHNMHLYRHIELSKEEPGFQKLFAVNEANFFIFEISSTDDNLKQFGPLEALIVFYPIRQILVIRIKSAFFSFQIDVNVLTKPFITATLTSLLRRIEKDLFSNIHLLKKQGHTYDISKLFGLLEPEYKLANPEQDNLPATRFTSDLLLSELNCKVIKSIGLKVCHVNNNNKFMIASIYASRPLNEPVNEEEEDPKDKVNEEAEVVKYGVEGRLREVKVPTASFPDKVSIDELISNPYLYSPSFKFGVSYFMFPKSSLYDLTQFVTSTLNSFVKMDEGLDLTSGRWEPYRLNVQESEVKLDPPVDGQTTAIVIEEKWVPQEGVVLKGFDFTPYNPVTVLSSPACIDIISQMNKEFAVKENDNGLIKEYRLVTKQNDQTKRIEQTWEFIARRMLLRVKKDII